MTNYQNYSIWEVESQSQVKRVDICDDKIHFGFEPQSTLELKEPGDFPMNFLVGILRGKAALHPFKKGDLVAVSLNFRIYKKKGELVNQIIIEDIKIVNKLDYLFV